MSKFNLKLQHQNLVSNLHFNFQSRNTASNLILNFNFKLRDNFNSSFKLTKIQRQLQFNINF